MSLPAHAASISVAGNELSDARAIYIRGLIETDDLQKLRQSGTTKRGEEGSCVFRGECIFFRDRHRLTIQ
jgi:hypothetical protein